MGQQPIIFLVSHPTPGGVQELWTDLADGFRAAGYPVLLAALYPAQCRQQEGRAWRHVRDARPAGLLGSLDLVAALVRLFRSERPRMVFAAMPAANVLAPLAASIAGVRTPVCISHHSPAFTHSRLLNAVDSLTGSLGSTRSIISVSNAVGTSLDAKPRRYREKRRTIRNALPPQVDARLQGLCAVRASQPRAYRKIVAIGRLSEEKNYPMLLRAARHLENVEIVVVGSGPLHASLQQLALQLGVASHVHFLGEMKREAALETLAGADIFAQPSIFEGHSLALLEAARLGLPLLVSDVPGQIEAITRADGTRCGIAVGLHDDLALAHTIRHLMETPAEYRHWSDAARLLAEEAAYPRMVHAYEQLMTP